jgi:hypothetical protein
MSEELLFHRHDLSAVFQNQEQITSKAIDALDTNRLLNTPVDDLVEYFFEEHKIQVASVLPDQISVDQSEAKIDVSRDQSRMIYDRSSPFYVDGTRVIFYIPFEGDKNLFYCRPSTFNYNPPRAVITNNELQFIYETLDHNAENVKSTFDGDLYNLKQYLGWIERDVMQFNSQLMPKIRGQVEKRRQKILNDRGMVASLGFPLRQRADTPKTFVVPIDRKKIKTLPPATTAPFTPEPTLQMEEYEKVLSIISHMVLVMERSPNAFRTMKEEDLRQHFLVQLNGQYEGQATGETFNYQGKTDILIRVNGKNIFIAECKFWKGEKAFLETITQLLGYTSWRDTKTAILVFCRNKKFSDIVQAIPGIVMKHPNFKRQLPSKDETASKYTFHQNDDPNRELIITIMAFNVPGNE